MNANSILLTFRKLWYRNPGMTRCFHYVVGEQVQKIMPFGFIIKTNLNEPTLTLIPWSCVVQFDYHQDDAEIVSKLKKLDS